MKRIDKFPDTTTFHFTNANPRNKYTDDCVIRAIATATGDTWDTVFTELCKISLKYKLMPTDSKCYVRYLEAHGWEKYPQPRKEDNTKYTGKEFCKKLASTHNHLPIIAHIGGHHIVAIVDNKVNDIWDSTDGCIGNYFIKSNYFMKR